MVARRLGYFIFVFDCNLCCLFYQIRYFQCYKKKKSKENRSKKKKMKTTKFGQNLNQSLGLRKSKIFHEGSCPLTSSLAGGLQHISPTCQITQLNQARFNRFRFAMLAPTVLQFFFLYYPLNNLVHLQFATETLN